MAVERTFSIIKPDATRRNLTGKINARFEEAGLRIVAQKRAVADPPAGRGLLRRAQGAAVLQRAVRLHDLRPGRRAGAGGRERRRQEPRGHGRHQSGQRRAPARSARTSPSRSRPIRCTARTRPRTPRSRSPISSPGPRSSAEDCDRPGPTGPATGAAERVAAKSAVRRRQEDRACSSQHHGELPRRPAVVNRMTLCHSSCVPEGVRRPWPCAISLHCRP